MIEILDQRRAVVLFDEVDQRLGQVVLVGEIDAVLDVADDDQRAHGRGQMVVPAVGAFGHVLDEVLRLEHLADVVEIGSHADEQSVGADGIGRRFADGCHGDRMVVRAGRAATSSCSSGCEMSLISSRLMSVTTPKVDSTNGRLPATRYPAARHQAAPCRLRNEKVVSFQTSVNDWLCRMPHSPRHRRSSRGRP